MGHSEGVGCQGHLSKSVCSFVELQVEPQPRKVQEGAAGGEGGRESVPAARIARVRSAQHNSLRRVLYQALGWAVQGTQGQPNPSVPGDLGCDGGGTDTVRPRRDPCEEVRPPRSGS